MSMPGTITYTNVTCPTCGAVLQAGYQSLSPEYLIADAQCPYCGTVVAHDVVSLSVVSGPTVAPYQSGIDISELMNMMITMMIVVMMMKMMMQTMSGV